MSTLRLVPTSGSPFEVTQDSALIGREPSCDISITDGSISRRHAKIERRGDSWVVIDQASANGTFLDSQKISEAPLKAGQELRLGAVSFKVEITGAAPMDDPGATVLQPVGVPAPPPPKPAAAPAPPPPKPAAAPAPAPPPPPKPAPAKAAAPPPPPKPVAPAKPVAPPPKATAGKEGGKKGKGPLFWISAGCCGCLSIALLLGALAGIWFYTTTKAPVDAVTVQLAEIKSGQLDAAYGRFSQSYQAMMSRSDFEQVVSAHATLRENASSSFWKKRSVQNNTAHLEGTITSSSNETENVTYELVKEDGSWKIQSIQFAGDSSTGGSQQ
jgi:hypothetical protein